MYTEINNRIFELKEKLRIKEKLESLRRMANEELNKKRIQQSKLKDQLIKEEKDVKRLEGISFSSIFLSIIGKKDDKLDKEKEEYLVAKLKYEECLETIEKLEKEIDYAEKELLKYEGVTEEYKNLIKEKENIMIQEDDENSKKLKYRLSRINNLKLEIKEIKEAIVAGENANSALSQMKNHLNTARGWGTWDMMGGGLISNMAKHSAINSANRDAQRFQYLLKSFKKELLDINQFTDINVNISGFTSFADFFFDGFFVDWFVQSKINSSISTVNSTSNKIEDLISDLRGKLSQVEGEKRSLEMEINKLLES